MSRWWRAYDDALNDPKIQRLPPHLFKTWFNILCIASKYGGDKGTLPTIEEIAYLLRRRVRSVAKDVTALRLRRLLDGNELLTPHNWGDRQFKSDLSTQRVRDYRKRFNPVSRNGKETPPEQKQSRTETDTPIRGANAPTSEADLFTRGKKILGAKSGGLISKVLKSREGNVALARAVLETASTKQDPHEYIGGVLRGAKNGNGNGYGNKFNSSRKSSEDALLAGMAKAAGKFGVHCEPPERPDDEIPLGRVNIDGGRTSGN